MFCISLLATEIFCPFLGKSSFICVSLLIVIKYYCFGRYGVYTGMPLSVKLLQNASYCGRQNSDDVLLASYDTNAAVFLHPLPSSLGIYRRDGVRQLLMCRTMKFEVGSSELLP